MKFTELYNKEILLWPKKIYIGDGYPIGKDGYFFPQLTSVHDEIEDNLSVDDDWSQIIIWSMFQAFHSESKSLVSKNIDTLEVDKLRKSEIEWRVSENLNSESWQPLLEEYKNDL